MSQLDLQTQEWLNGLKMGGRLQYLSDFQNGYYLGVIFERMNMARGRKFKNSKDMACRFHNFKNVRDLLMENFNVDFPIQNILYNTHNLLNTIRDCCQNHNRRQKEATFQRIHASQSSTLKPQPQDQFIKKREEQILGGTGKWGTTTKLPKKIQDIEAKLDKFRQIKTKQEVMALEERRRELEENRRAVEDHRLFQLNKLRTNHEFTKEHQRKVHEVWLRTEQVKHARIQKDNALKTFLAEKQAKFHQSLRDQQTRGIREGLQAFELNCMRQGVELEHDPDKVKDTSGQQAFNGAVVMERIRDNIKQHEKEKKERIKRENRKNVDAKIAKEKAQSKGSENNLVEYYAKQMHAHLSKCEDINAQALEKSALKEAAIEKRRARSHVALPAATVAEIQEMEEKRISNRIECLDGQVRRLQKRNRQHKAIAEQVLEALLGVVIQNEDHYATKGGFTYGEWQILQNSFLSYSEHPLKILKNTPVASHQYEAAIQYAKAQRQWRDDRVGWELGSLSKTISTIIDKAHPMQQTGEKEEVALYMPLKVAVIGERKCGKSSIAAKIAQKYGSILINPLALIEEAVQLNQEPPSEDPKKKKDSKKPEEESPQKIALKAWGENLLKTLDDLQRPTVDHIIGAISYQLKQSFSHKSRQELASEFDSAKEEESARTAKAIKEWEEAQKKAKKGAEPTDPPTERKYFYSKGFVLDLPEISIETAKIIQRRLNGFIAFDERLNPKAESSKAAVSNIVPLQPTKRPTQLQKSTFDLIFELQVTPEALQQRRGEEVVSSEVDLKQLQEYYSIFGHQDSKTPLYHSVTNEGTIEECLESIDKIVQPHLDRVYAEILKEKEAKEKRMAMESQVEQAPSGGDVDVKNEQKQGTTQKAIQQSENVAQQVQPSNAEQQVQEVHAATEKELQQQKPPLNPIDGLTPQKSSQIAKRFQEVYETYLGQVSEPFCKLENLRGEFGEWLLSQQAIFINIINRPDDKAGKILNFQQNYNKLLLEKTSVVKDVQAVKHLIAKLDHLYDGLWTSLEEKKNEAIVDRKKFLACSELEQSAKSAVQVGRQLLQAELNLWTGLVFGVWSIVVASEGGQADIPTEFMQLGIPPQKQPITSFTPESLVSKRMEYYCEQVKRCWSQLPQWLRRRQAKLKIPKNVWAQGVISELGREGQIRMQARVAQVQEWIQGAHLEYYCLWKAQVNKMDDWIIQGIKAQNEFVYQIYKQIRSNMQQAKKSSVKDLFVRDITDSLHPIAGLPPQRLPILPDQTYNSFPLLSFAVLVIQMRYLGHNSRIPFKVFSSYFQKRKKSKMVHHDYLRVDLDIVQQYLVSDDYLNFKEVAFAILFWNTRTLREDAINQYQQALTGITESQTSDILSESPQEEIPFEEFRLMPGVTSDPKQERILTKLVCQIFRDENSGQINIKEFLETLRLFNQLQIFRYGDAVMILHQSPHKERK